ncbi:hypothetical protein [Streptomyces sp. AK02-01A]|uniref:hypothetical protein n=1 Tax=Streptomyces sp. AK02-01A TaxID=3028648 RepID=UPI0029B73777|nr:hypothetical protein [Streptomyces sp. AK02-01A]MDX3849307.1 hypothetical protein [Streptomyces sp. AK02-01A]
MAQESLRAQYEALLRAEGRTVRRALAEGEARAYGAASLYERISSDFRRTLAEADIALPEPVLVAKYPHESFNAQARAVRGGTLILVNAGFSLLVLEMSKAFAASLGFFSRDEDGGITVEAATPAVRERRRIAERGMARSVLAYLFQGDAAHGGRQPLDADSAAMARLLTEATERFVVAHEFAHLLEGHLATPAQRGAGEWLHRTREQEFQADETGMLLLLRALEDGPEEQLASYLAVAGPLFFFAIDHLITRVRNEIDDIPQGMRLSDHPGSDERGAALRALLTDIHGPLVLHMADACVQWLSWHEDGIVTAARGQLAG